MSSAPASRTCQGGGHVDAIAPLAVFVCDQHGCDNYRLCADCESRERGYLEETFASGGTVTCTDCGRTFERVEDCVTVTPLGSAALASVHIEEEDAACGETVRQWRALDSDPFVPRVAMVYATHRANAVTDDSAAHWYVEAVRVCRLAAELLAAAADGHAPDPAVLAALTPASDPPPGTRIARWGAWNAVGTVVAPQPWDLGDGVEAPGVVRAGQVVVRWDGTGFPRSSSVPADDLIIVN
ncbi:hypothetical protein [Nocardia transvalensis]|uniref:hypothetical protein n=1 Tax=Nocardia transvalensis TaxID=37333 RepID=UPI001894501B|nr:hypothetical protein [Nocardia transvalensis]MBF6333540.1 hypothetical protein [Nocardia transvalensis]